MLLPRPAPAGLNNEGRRAVVGRVPEEVVRDGEREVGVLAGDGRLLAGLCWWLVVSGLGGVACMVCGLD